MDLYPAIDLRGGMCVQLAQGDYSRESVYGDDPVRIARSFAEAGAPWIHMVDLDAARSGHGANHDLIAAVAAAVKVPVQCGGGIRSLETAERLLSAGVARVVIGTAAFSDPDLVARLARRHPGRVAVGLDHRAVGGRRELAVQGWTEGAGRDLFEALASVEDWGAAAVIVTDITRDGMLAGPDLEGMAQVLSATELPVVASGGVSGLGDLAALAGLDVGGRQLAGAIVGTALYERRFSLEEGLAACVR